MRNRFRLRFPIAAIALLALSGCYETQIPVVTQQNAHSIPVIADGEYCEVAFRPEAGDAASLATTIRPDHCIALNWVAEARGWRSNDARLGADEHGVSIRVRKLGEGADAVGQSRFFMAQAGPTPKSIVMGGRSVAVATARLMGVLPAGVMFAVIDARMPHEQVIARSRQSSVGLSAGQNGLTIPFVSLLSSETGDVVGHWLARELAHEIHAAAESGTVRDPSVVRIFVRRDGGETQALGERVRAMLDAVVFEADKLNQALALGLAQIYREPVPAPSPAPGTVPATSAPAVSQLSDQRIYDALNRCTGMLASVRLHAVGFGAKLQAAKLSETQAGNPKVARGLEILAEQAAGLSEVAGKTIDELAPLSARMEQFGGVNVAQGTAAYNAGAREIQYIDPTGMPPHFESLMRASDRLYQAFEQAMDCLDAIERYL